MVTERDYLFYYQLLLPIGDTTKSKIENDPRMSYYSKVENWSNMYSFQIGLGGTYGHKFKNIKVEELVHHDGCVVRDGVRGGSSGAIYRRWLMGSDFDDYIFRSQTHRRWLQIKRVKKLCNNQTVAKKGTDEYDPAYKFDYIYKCLINNVNAITKDADLDLCGDETSWATGSYGEHGAGLVGRIQGKPGVSKGGQTVLISDVHRIRPRAYLHRHKLHEKPQGWTRMGQVEVRLILEKLVPMVRSKPHMNGINQIFSRFPHTTWDNYFSGDKIMDWLGQRGFGAMMTCRRDLLPAGIPGKYLHKKKTDVSKRTKVARYLEPVVCVKNMPAERHNAAHKRVHVSFQSTSSCNFTTVNSINECSVNVEQRERGQGPNKRLWGIEMNSARKLYLGTYSRIDSIDHLIKNCRMKYRTWKYWHSPMIHAQALAIVTAYDIYCEVVDGDLDGEWRLDGPVDFWSFRDRLSIQMLEYSPLKRKYPGDSAMRSSTQQRKKDRVGDQIVGPRRGRPKRASHETREADAFVKAFKTCKRARGNNSRLCGDLSMLQHHMNSLETGRKHPKKCVVCGEDSHSFCGICGKALHMLPTRGPNVNKTCFIHYHSDSFFGLAKEDSSVALIKKKDWVYPSPAKMRQHQATYNHFHTLMNKED